MIPYFSNIEPENRLSKENTNFQFGAYGEGSGVRSSGVRIKTSGVNEYRVLRPRLMVPVQDGYQYQMQARVLSTVGTSGEYQGVGLQARAFHGLDQVWVNSIDTNPALWLREQSFTEWRYLTSVDRIPRGIGSQYLVPELVVTGESGYVDVTSIRVRTMYDELVELIQPQGVDTRVYDRSTITDNALLQTVDILDPVPVDLVPGQVVNYSFSGNYFCDYDLSLVYLAPYLRKYDGVEEPRNYYSTIGAIRANTTTEISGERSFKCDKRYNQLRFKMYFYGAPSDQPSNHSFTDLQINVHVKDIVKSGN